MLIDLLIAAGSVQTVLETLINNAAVIITALLSGIAALRANKATKLGEENRESILSGNVLTQAAKDEAVAARQSFSDQVKQTTYEGREFAEQIRQIIAAEREQAEARAQAKEAALHQEIVRLNHLLVASHQKVETKVAQVTEIAGEISQDVKAIRATSDSGSFAPVKAEENTEHGSQPGA